MYRTNCEWFSDACDEARSHGARTIAKNIIYLSADESSSDENEDEGFISYEILCSDCPTSKTGFKRFYDNIIKETNPFSFETQFKMKMNLFPLDDQIALKNKNGTIIVENLPKTLNKKYQWYIKAQQFIECAQKEIYWQKGYVEQTYCIQQLANKKKRYKSYEYNKNLDDRIVEEQKKCPFGYCPSNYENQEWYSKSLLRQIEEEIYFIIQHIKQTQNATN